MAQGQFIKVYHVLRDEYPDVWKSDAQLALFVRLLMVADKWWPQWAPIPRRNGAYRSLLASGLVLENKGGTAYSIRGLHTERSRRSEHGRHAVRMRWAYSENTQPLPSKAEQNIAEQSTGNNSENDRLPPTFMGFKHRWQPNLKDIERQHEESRRQAAELRQKREQASAQDASEGSGK